jgi:predicted enzyme related to lactoylglutathione lyase
MMVTSALPASERANSAPLTRGLRTALIATAMVSISLGCQRPESDVEREANSGMSILHLVEIVSNDVGALTELYQDLHGLSFGPPDPDLGQARVATRADGTLVGIRAPLAEHDTPIVRTYFEVDDIHEAVRKAEAAGAITAYPPTLQGQRGTFAIVFHGDVQLGLWQR